MKILLIGNSLLSLEKLQQHLAETGLQAEIAACTTGPLAVEILAKCVPDVLIAHLDFFAGKGGGEALRRLKAENPRVYTLSIARPEDYSGLPAALEAEIDDYLTYPFAGPELVVRLRKAFLKVEKQPGAAPGTPCAAHRAEDIKTETVSAPALPALAAQTEYEQRSLRGGRRRSARPGRAEKTRTSPVLRILGNVFFAILLFAMTAMAFFLAQSKLRGGPPEVAGFRMYVVLSGSMKPAFDTGSLVLVRQVDPAAVVPGDIITYRSLGNGMLTTHRVVEVRHDGEAISFVTRGDANNVNDPNLVPAANLVGRVSGTIPYLGYLMGFAQTRQGLIFLVFIPGTLIIVFELRNVFHYSRKPGEQKKAPAGESATDGKKAHRRSGRRLAVSPRAGLITTNAAPSIERHEQ